MDAWVEFWQSALGIGLESKDIDVLQMSLRAVVIYFVTLGMVRLGKRRFFGRTTPIDVILGIMLGSIVSRAVTGNAPFGPALAASASLVAIHWIVSYLTVHWHGLGRLVKGEPRLLVKDGTIEKAALDRAHMSDHDLWEELHVKGISHLSQVAEARLERNGKVSVIKPPSEAKIVDIAVADGVQTVRVELVHGRPLD